jgi:hypothetical protein
MDEAVVRARKDQGGHTSGHTGESGPTVVPGTTGQPVELERVYGATRRDRTGDLLITNWQQAYFQRVRSGHNSYSALPIVASYQILPRFGSDDASKAG